MTAASCGLLTLPDELIVDIASYCRAEDLAHLLMTCKRLNTRCDARTLWLSLLRDLDVTQAPDIAPQELLDTLPTHVLRAKVIRALVFDRSWRTTGALRAVKKATAYIGPRVMPAEFEADGIGRVEPQLLPGGSHAVVENRGQLQLWSVDPAVRLWVAPYPAHGRLDCTAYEFELQKDGAELIIAAAYIDVERARTFFTVYRVCMWTFASTTVLIREMPMIFMFRLLVCGDIIMVHLPLDYQVILCNWKVSSFAALKFPQATRGGTNNKSALLAHRHLLVVLHLGAFSLISIPLSSLEGHWVKTDSISQLEQIELTFSRASPWDPNPADTEQFPGLLRFSLSEPKRAEDGPWVLALHTFTPSWRDTSKNALSEVFVVAFDKGPDGRTNNLLSYRLQLSQVSETETSLHADSDSTINGLLQQVTARGWRLRLINQNRAHAETLPWNQQSISHAGRMFSLHGTLNCYTLFTDEPQPTNRLPVDTFLEPQLKNDPEPDPVVLTVEPSSGDVAIGTPGVISVVRFEHEES